MSLESFGYIKDLVASNPLGIDPKSEGDDHLRGIKSTLKSQFSGFTLGKPITVNEDQINALATLLDKIYPVGAIFHCANETDPATLIGIGTWARIAEGQFLMNAGVSYTIGSTGGADTVVLNASQMPSHSHNIQTFSQGVSFQTAVCGQTANVNTGTRATDVQGADGGHENLPPYLAVAIWQRTA